MSAAPCAAALVLVLATTSSAVRAEPKVSGSDGVYGRFDGDLDLSLAAGAAFARGGPTGALMARALYLNMVGPYVSFTDAFGSDGPVPPRSLAVGLSFRPLFLPRWGYDLEHGPAMLDLTLDAITFDFGALWSADQAKHLTSSPGVELALGTEIPLAGQAQGPWLGGRAVLRWRERELGASDTIGDTALTPAFFVTLAWHFLANVHLADAGDRMVR